MKLEDYKQRMADLGVSRGNLDTGLPPESRATVRELHEPAYLPGGYEKSMVPEPPPAEDLSHLNGKSWRKAQAVGRRNGGKWRKAKE